MGQVQGSIELGTSVAAAVANNSIFRDVADNLVKIKDNSGNILIIGNSVTSASIIGDNLLVRGDGAVKGVQNSGISLDDSDNFTGINSMKLTPISTPAHSAGMVFYDTDDDELAFYNSEADVKLNIGTEVWVKVRNNSGATINDFTPVYQTGAVGNRATIAKAQADSELTSMVIGLTTHQIENNTNGFITVIGTINEVDTDGSPFTETWVSKEEIFLSAAVAGEMTNVAPTGNNKVVSLGKVLTATNNGSFHVTLDGANVRGISSSTDNTIVRFDGTSGKRIQGSPVTINDSGVITGATISGGNVSIATGVGSPTVDQLQEYLDNTGSSGFFTGGGISDGGAGTVDVAAGSGFIRTTNDSNAELQSFKWSASAGIAVTDDTTQYIYVNDAGAITLSSDEFLETPDKIQIGVVTDEGGSIVNTFNLGVRLNESIGQAGRFIRRVHGVTRDKRRGGLIMGQSEDVNRDISITAGTLWWGRTEYDFSSFDTSGADTFQTYSANGQEDAVASQFPNEQYDNLGTLTTMTNNRWANLFVFIVPGNGVIMIYGRDEFLSEALADTEGVPNSSLPSKVSQTSLLIARLTFQKSSDIGTISSAFETLFANASVTDHGNLAGLTDDDHAQYSLVDGTRAFTGNVVLTNATADAHALNRITADGRYLAQSGVLDTVFRIQDDGDITKQIAFQASGITTATTHTITMPDDDVDLADINTNATDIITNASNILLKAPKFPTTITSAGNFDTLTTNDDSSTNILMTSGTTVTLDKTGLTVGYQRALLNDTGGDLTISSADTVKGDNVALPNGKWMYFVLLNSTTWGISVSGEINLVDDTTPQAGGELDMQAHSIGGTVQTATGDGTTTIDWKLGNMFDFQFGAFDETFTFTAPTKPGTFILKLVQDSVGTRLATWPGTVKWPGGSAPTLTTTLTTGTDIITFYYNGTSYFAVDALDFS